MTDLKNEYAENLAIIVWKIFIRANNNKKIMPMCVFNIHENFDRIKRKYHLVLIFGIAAQRFYIKPI